MKVQVSCCWTAVCVAGGDGSSRPSHYPSSMSTSPSAAAAPLQLSHAGNILALEMIRKPFLVCNSITLVTQDGYLVFCKSKKF